MALFENFPYENLHELNLDWLIDVLNKMKEGQVTSVNGQTGDVVLYENANIVFPDVSQTRWRMLRNVNGHSVGIAFDEDGTGYIIYDGYQRRIYDYQHEPPYPVTSVNGETGAVVLYSGQSMELPALTGQQLTDWKIFRELNGVTRGISFGDNGTASIINGNNTDQLFSNDHPQFENDLDILFPEYEDANNNAYWIGRYFNQDYHGFKIYENGRVSIMTDDNTEHPLYIQGINDPSDFAEPNDAILELDIDLASGTQWGIVRKCSGVTVGIVFMFNSTTLEWDAYIKKDNTLTKLLTVSDIPSSAGVVSINNKTGAVTLYGAEIQLTAYTQESISQAIAALRTTDDTIRSSLAVLATGDVHMAIPAGGYVYIKDHPTLAEGLYKAPAAIAEDAALTTSNVEQVSNILADLIWPTRDILYTESYGTLYGMYQPLTGTAMLWWAGNSNASITGNLQIPLPAKYIPRFSQQVQMYKGGLAYIQSTGICELRLNGQTYSAFSLMYPI